MQHQQGWHLNDFGDVQYNIIKLSLGSVRYRTIHGVQFDP